jgi:hypothetical protein
MVTQSKREYNFKCERCGKTYLKWTGICYSGCNFSGTVKDIQPDTNKSKSTGGTADARRLRRRAKDSERDIAKRMLVVDGADPNFRNIASSTGRIGHITGMRIDAISKHYVTENKNRKMPTWLITAWVLINQRAVDFSKNALLHIDPPNMPKTFVIQGGNRKLDTMAIITQERHEELIKNERVLSDIMHEIGKHREFESLEQLYLALQAEDKAE